MLVIFGLGYVGRAVAAAARRIGLDVAGTARTPLTLDDVRAIPPSEVAPLLGEATDVLVTAAPGEQGDPLLALPGAEAALRSAPVRWVGYFSTTGVYGDRSGAWVDETTVPAPGLERSRRRVRAEAEWGSFADNRCVDIFRLAGIYGPGRSPFDDLRSGRARRIVKPGHCFGRIHRDDIVRAVLAALERPPPSGLRVFNLADDEPAEPARVIEEAARLLGVPAPPAIPFDAAAQAMSPMARSFWAENRKVRNARTKAALGIAWRYPTFREGLRAILAEERA